MTIVTQKVGKLDVHLLILEFPGTFVFALRGAMTGVKQRLGLFGGMTDMGAGLVRDLRLTDLSAVQRAVWPLATATVYSGCKLRWQGPLTAREAPHGYHR